MATTASQVRLSASRAISDRINAAISGRTFNKPVIIASVAGIVCMAATLLQSDAVMYISGFITLAAVAAALCGMEGHEEGGEI